MWQGHRRFGVCRLVSTVYRTISAHIRVFFPLFLLHFLGLRYRGGSQHGDRGGLDQAGDAQSFSIQTRVQRALRRMYHSRTRGKRTGPKTNHLIPTTSNYTCRYSPNRQYFRFRITHTFRHYRHHNSIIVIERLTTTHTQSPTNCNHDTTNTTPSDDEPK